MQEMLGLKSVVFKFLNWSPRYHAFKAISIKISLHRIIMFIIVFSMHYYYFILFNTLRYYARVVSISSIYNFNLKSIFQRSC